MRVVARKTATTAGSRHSRPIATQVRGRPASLISSTRITRGPPGVRAVSDPGPVSATTTSSRLRRCSASPSRGTPCSTRWRASADGPPGAASTTSVSSWRSATARPSSRAAPSGSGVRTTSRPVGPRTASRASSSTSRPRSTTPTVVHSASISASRWLDRKTVVPRRVQLDEQVPDLPDAVRVEPVRRLVEHQQPGPVEQRARQPEALAHAERVGAHRAPVDRAEPDALEDLLDPPAPARPVPAAPRARTRRAARGWSARTGAGRRPVPRPSPRSPAARRPPGSAPSRPSTVISPRVA